MSTGMKRAAVALLVVLAGGTATSGATYTASSGNPQTVTAAADFGVTVTMVDPGSPRRSSVNLSAIANETQGGTITSVAIQRSPAGAGTWTTVCTVGSAPWTCSLDTTTLANGQYDFRARATNQNGYSRTSPVVSSRLFDNAAPSITFVDPGGWLSGTVALSATASDTGGSGVASVRFEYKTLLSGSWNTACTVSAAPYSCSFDTSLLGALLGYDFRAVATDGAGNTTNSNAVTNVRADNAAPSGTLSSPGTILRGAVTLSGSASDGDSGVASARMQYSAAGAGSWSDACVDTSTPFSSCSWNTTTVTDGLYDLRTLVTDVAGNTYASTALTSRRVDNTNPLTTLTAPAALLSGTVTLNATGTDTGGSGVADVRIQRSPAGAATWTDICTDTTSTYSCSWNTTTLAEGLYDLRSVATDNAGNTGTSTTVTDRRVDNLVPSASDVQTADAGGTPDGLIETGDSMTLTYSEAMDPASIIAGWDGSGGQSIHMRFAHAGSGDRVLFYNAANTVTIPLAGGIGVDLKADYVPNTNPVYTATLTRSAGGDAFTATIGTRISGGYDSTPPLPSTMQWTPSAAARDFASKACTTTVRSESGAPDVQF